MPAQVVRTEPKPRPRTPEAIPLPTLPHLPDPPRPSNSEQRDVAQAVQTALLCGLAAGTDGADQCAATWRPSAAAVQATARCLLPSIAPTPPPILAARRVLLTSSLAAAPAATPVATVAPCLDWLSGANSVSRRGTAERFRLAARAAAGPPATAPMTELPEEIPSAAHEHSAPGAVGTGTAERPPTAGLHDQCGAVAAATDFGGALAGGARRVTAAAAGLCWPAADMYAQQDEEVGVVSWLRTLPVLAAGRAAIPWCSDAVLCCIAASAVHRHLQRRQAAGAGAAAAPAACAQTTRGESARRTKSARRTLHKG